VISGGISPLSGLKLSLEYIRVSSGICFFLEYSKSRVKTLEDICFLHTSGPANSVTMCQTGVPACCMAVKPDFALEHSILTAHMYPHVIVQRDTSFACAP